MNRCDGCELSHLGNKYRICIPLPSHKIRGCVISRDATSEFLDPLKKYRQLPENQKGNLLLNAPPLWLSKKIKVIMNFDDNSPDMKKLQDFFNSECYWTHLHKCPTKPGKKQDLDQDDTSGMKEDFPPFHYTTAKLCANRWFESEFKEYGLKDKIIVTLGGDVKKSFKQSSNNHGLENSNKIISLPHPSGRCRSWNPNADHTKIIKEITRLLDLLDADVE